MICQKANEEIFNLFLQVLDEGFLTDNTGKKVDFKNTIIILTSNVGTKRALQEKAIGFNDRRDEKYKHVLERELKDKFPPEFINRLDDVIFFNSLTKDNLLDIIRIEMDKVVERLRGSNFDVKISENVAEYIYKTIESETEYGARPVKRAIQKEIENKIVDLILENEEKSDFSVVVEDNLVKVV